MIDELIANYLQAEAVHRLAPNALTLRLLKARELSVVDHLARQPGGRAECADGVKVQLETVAIEGRTLRYFTWRGDPAVRISAAVVIAAVPWRRGIIAEVAKADAQQ